MLLERSLRTFVQGFDLDADGVVVPLMRPLMRPDRFIVANWCI